MVCFIIQQQQLNLLLETNGSMAQWVALLICNQWIACQARLPGCNSYFMG